jgi:uncharacterized protein (UPF0335 family)
MPVIVAEKRLKSFVERIETVEDEIDDRKIDRRAVYAEAKGEGFDVKVLRKVIARRRRDEQARTEEDELIELYEAAIDGQMKLPLGETETEAEAA